ncbi:cinnamoyl-CoA reductase [Fusarium austroafricanum]|uniref:Cinnamoyl-CoA reductase n=1 Tax=Fusarium austroafricanum TaxID=2364996 RepID=A0A8H4P922_9HYPO|nr:cinnamoyl-CoA reductase [Fusarium austroafricanum]
MSTTKQARIIVVTGAGGGQGGGIVRALLASDQDWHVRALTKNTKSSSAEALREEYPRELESGRLSFVQADAYDLNSLRPAFAGAYGVFAATSEVRHGKVLVEEAEMLHEIEAGRNMVTAAKEAGVEHFVLSSLPDMVKATGGRFPGIHHMNNKHAIEQIAKESLKAVTSLIPGFFYTNMKWPHYSQRLSDGVVKFVISFPSQQPAQWVDAPYDMGRFTARVFDLGVEKTAGKTYLVMSQHITPEEMATIFTRVTGQPAIHDPISPSKFGELTAPFIGPAFQADAQQMMEWASIMPADKVCYGTMEAEKMDETFNDLGLKASTWEEWLRRSGWKGPE